MQRKDRRASLFRVTAAAVLIAFVLAGCGGNGGGFSDMTDTTKGAVVGGAGAAALGALIYQGNPLAGALIGAASGVLVGGIVGHFMDERKKDMEQALAPQINAGLVTVEVLPGHAVLIKTTRESAFEPGSSVLSQGVIPTLQTIAKVITTYGKTTVAVIGHPDAKGTITERKALATQRAEAARNTLIAMNVSPVLVTASGNTESQHLDGRLEIIVHPLVSQ